MDSRYLSLYDVSWIELTPSRNITGLCRIVWCELLHNELERMSKEAVGT
jgi:hypothetical protein